MADTNTSSDDRIRGLAKRVVRELSRTGRKLATAESCTGGWIAKAITDIDGSSAVFEYGIVSYSNDAKTSLLKVPSQTLRDHGAVSAPTVAAMAEGALALSEAGISVAVSGVAGPTGGTVAKPVGTVWFAWSVTHATGTDTATEVGQFGGDRDEVRRKSVAHALQGLLERLP